MTMFLVIDDELDMCWALQNILKEAGFLSKAAPSGHEALFLMQGEKYDLVFLDAKLPDIDGLDLAEFIRRIDPTVKIVMVSGYFYRNDVAIQKAFEEKLINGFISKPFLNEEIIDIIYDNNLVPDTPPYGN